MGIFTELGARAAGTVAGGWIKANLLWVKVGLIVLAVIAVWAWDRNRLGNAYERGKEDAERACATANAERLVGEAKAAIAAMDGWAAQQRAALDTAVADKAATDQAMVDVDARLQRFERALTRLKPLPVDCKADPDRVRETNLAMGHAS